MSAAATVALAVGILTIATGDASAQPKREQAWKRSDSAHFTFFYNGSEKGVRRLSQDLETLRALIGSLAPGGAPASPRPTYVYVFAGEKSYRPYYPIRDGKPWPVSSYFSPRREANYVSVDGSGDVRKPAFTAYGFDLVDTHFTNLPYWLHRGLAEYYGTFRASAKKLDVGRPDVDNLRILAEGALIPMERLFSAERGADFLRSNSMRLRFAAQSWATVHYLLHSERRRGQIDRYLHLLGQGVPEPDAFSASFQTPKEKFTIEVFNYIGSKRFFFGQLDADRVAIDPTFSTTSVPWDETLARLGDLLAVSENREPDAIAHYEAALSLNPEQPAAHVGLGLLDYHEERHDDAIAHFESALEADPGDFRANLFLSLATTEPRSFGDAWWEDLPEESREALTKARSAAERCIEREPELAACHSQLGYTYFWTKDPAVGIAALEKALALQPARDWTALQLIRLLRNAGRPVRATELLTMYQNRFDERQKGEAAQAIRRARINAFYRAADSGDFETALEHLEIAISQEKSPSEREKLEAQRERIAAQIEGR